MKLKLTYLPEEREEADADLAVFLQRHPQAKVRRDKSKAPKLAVYLATQERSTKNGPETFANVRPEGNQKNTDPHC